MHSLFESQKYFHMPAHCISKIPSTSQAETEMSLHCCQLCFFCNLKRRQVICIPQLFSQLGVEYVG